MSEFKKKKFFGLTQDWDFIVSFWSGEFGNTFKNTLKSVWIRV
jgi:hypothetical protein